MATPAEHIAIWILEAIEAEALREPDIGKRRIDGYVLGEVMAAHNLDGTDIDRGRLFLAERSLINAVGVDGGTVTYAFPDGAEYLKAYKERTAQVVSAKIESLQKKRLSFSDWCKIFGIVSVLVGAIWTVYVWLHRDR